MNISDRVQIRVNAFNDHADAAMSAYIGNLVLPYGRAHRRAFHEFDSAIRGKLKADQAGFDLTLGALSLVGGGLLTRIFATAALKAVAGKIAVDVLQRTTLKRALDWAKLPETHPTTIYLLGGVWDTAASVLSSDLRSRLEPTAESSESIRKFSRNPFLSEDESYLEQFVRDCRDRLFHVANEIGSSKSHSDDDKIRLLDQLKASSTFVRGHPTRPITRDERRLRAEIELCLWMKFLLSRDYVWTREWDPNCMNYEVKKQEIRTSPTSPGYPRGPGRGNVVSGPHYDQVHNIWGNAIGQRIDRVHMELFSAPFFGSRPKVVRGTLQYAEFLLGSLSQNHLRALQASL